MIAKCLVSAILRRDQFNAAHPPGTYVRHWQSMREGEWIITSTNGPAFIHGNGVVVYVRGTSMPVYLSNLEVVSQETLQAILQPKLSPRSSRGRELALPAGDRW